MASSMWVAIAVISVVAIIMNGTVRIIRAGKGGANNSRIQDLENVTAGSGRIQRAN